MLIKLIPVVMKLFMFLTHYQSLILVLIHPVPQKLNTLLTLSVFPNTASNDIQQHVNSAISADVDNDSKSDCHSDLHSCARVFRSIMI